MMMYVAVQEPLTTSLLYNEIQEAWHVLESHLVPTPILYSPLLNQALGVSLWFKAENLQQTGAFKFRGATYFLSKLTPEQKQQGIVSFSSGNHAQAVAAAAYHAGISAKIVMPHDAPRIKVQGTRAWGAEVILYHRHTESREAIAASLAEKEGRMVVPPFDHLWTMAGQATVAKEWLKQMTKTLPHALDHVLIPCSGGGLSAGMSCVFHQESPNTRCYVVEPEGFEDTKLSLEQGKVMKITPSHTTLCDALALTQPGYKTLDILKQTGVLPLSSTDLYTQQAMYLLWKYLKVVVEPGGAVGLGAILQAKAEGKPLFQAHEAIGVVLSGGNADPDVFQTMLKACAESEPA
ncbi:MAG: threonine/serine dehydratase [Vampirovibrionales bacterium]